MWHRLCILVIGWGFYIPNSTFHPYDARVEIRGFSGEDIQSIIKLIREVRRVFPTKSRRLINSNNNSTNYVNNTPYYIQNDSSYYLCN